MAFETSMVLCFVLLKTNWWIMPVDSLKSFHAKQMFFKAYPVPSTVCSEDHVSGGEQGSFCPRVLPSFNLLALVLSRDACRRDVCCEEAWLLDVAPRAVAVCQTDFPSLLACADSHQQAGNENICASIQPLELLRPANVTVMRSALNTAVRN